ncbi:MAG: hypothetical protein WC291_12115 [Thermodesulfovibrionales bacterium]
MKKTEKRYMLVHDGNSTRICDICDETIPCSFVYGRFDSGKPFIGTLKEAEEYRDLAIKNVGSVNYIVVQVSGPDDRLERKGNEGDVERLSYALEQALKQSSGFAAELHHIRELLHSYILEGVHNLEPRLLLDYINLHRRTSDLEHMAEEVAEDTTPKESSGA